MVFSHPPSTLLASRGRREHGHEAEAYNPETTRGDGQDAHRRQRENHDGNCERREQAFLLYRDFGPQRCLRMLCEVLKLKWPANYVCHVTLQAWSKRDGWPKRIADFDLGQTRERAKNPVKPDLLLSTVDPVDALQQAASQALQAIARASQLPVVRAGDVKSLLEAARTAMDLADRNKSERPGTSTAEEIAAFGAKPLQRVETRVAATIAVPRPGRASPGNPATPLLSSPSLNATFPGAQAR